MSTLAGIFHTDGRPVARGDLASLTRHLSHRIGASEGTWFDDAVGLFERTLEAASSTASQPWRDARFAVAFDGRLDNRRDLAQALDLGAGGHLSDAAIVASAYERWTGGAAGRLLGDFAFTLWDRVERRLFCARDAVGVRPFYYRVAGPAVAWASEPHPLVRVDRSTARPNDAIVGEFLANAVVDKHETLLAGVLRLPPAHTLTVDRGGARLARYWDIDPSRELAYRDEREYVDHLQALMREAVDARLRGSSRVGVLLSGGVDSSLVLGVARKSDAPVAAGLRAYTLGSAADVDDAPAARRVADYWRVPHVVEPAALSQPLCLADDVRRYLDMPDYPSASVAAPLGVRAREDGVRVLLTGLAADDWFGGSLFRYADDLRRGSVLHLATEMARAARSPDFDGWYLSVRAACWPLVPARAQRAVLAAMGRHGVPPWIDRAFASRIDLADRIRRHPAAAPFGSLARYDVWREGSNAWRAHALEFQDRLDARSGVEHRHPFYDRRLIEFAVALPERMRWRGGETKYLLRRAAAAHVPPGAERHRPRGDSSRLLTRVLDEHGGTDPARALRAADHGWVDRREAARLVERLAAERARGALLTSLWPVWNLFAIDLWCTHALRPEVQSSDSAVTLPVSSMPERCHA